MLIKDKSNRVRLIGNVGSSKESDPKPWYETHQLSLAGKSTIISSLEQVRIHQFSVKIFYCRD